jgi:glycosyltransferase involved in cell wall biosynthesis
MRIHIVAPALPPALDGIGDHSARLAAGLAAAAEVTLIAPVGPAFDPVTGVQVLPAFSPERRRSTGGIVARAVADRPDWLVLQYNPFCYGRWGLNLSLPRVVQQVKRRLPGTRFALFAHEQFVPVHDWKHAVMTTWQRWQFRQLGRAAEVILSSIDLWAVGNRKRFPGTPVVHMPVGSNVPRVNITRDEARARLGLTDADAVLGVFGRTHNSRLMDPLTHAIAAARAAGHRPVLLYIGPDVDAFAATAAAGTRVIADGPADADEVSRRLSGVDVFLSPFEDGVSTRRGSFLAALQHGLAVAGTRGAYTDPVFRDTDGTATLLADADDPHCLDANVVRLLGDAELRRRVGAAGAELSEREFAWPVLIRRFTDALAGREPLPVGAAPGTSCGISSRFSTRPV